jgi:dihydrolipoamide dehydrogenase
MADQKFDLVVIGAGPGGYVAAIRAAQLGLKTALVEKRATLGGTCLNVGCIPAKALLHSTEIAWQTQHHAAEHGVLVDSIKIDLATLMKKKDSVVERLVSGVTTLVEKRGIQSFQGSAKLLGNGQVEVTSAKDKVTLTAQHILLATGSKPAAIPVLPFDGKDILSSDEAIALDKVPGELIVVGAGAIGLELGSVWARLGSKVTVVEFLPQIAPTYDSDVARLAERVLKKQGIEFALDTKVTGFSKKKNKLVVTAEQKGKTVEFSGDKVLVAVGRVPVIENLGLETAGVELTERKRIKIDAHFKTTAAGIYAIGDVVDGPMLAHKAEEEGVACVERIAGKAGHVNYDVIPNVIYIEPEVAGVGITETEAKKRGLAIKVGKFNLAANGRAIASDAVDGLVKIVADEKTDRVLGAQIVAHNASEMIASIVAHMEYGGSAEDIGRTVHAHPTISESIKEAALAVHKEAIHAL